MVGPLTHGSGGSTSALTKSSGSVPFGRPGEALALADQAIGLAQDDPARAAVLARRARDQAGRDPRVASRAERALGLAAKELNRLDDAAVHLRRSVSLARRAASIELEAEARMSLGLVRA
jgi:hypothetical protein